MVKKKKEKAKPKPKEFPISAKVAKKNNIEARCLARNCQKVVRVKDVIVYAHPGKSEDKVSFRFRIGGVCSECGTKVSRMLGQEAALGLIKGGKK